MTTVFIVTLEYVFFMYCKAYMGGIELEIKNKHTKISNINYDVQKFAVYVCIIVRRLQDLMAAVSRILQYTVQLFFTTTINIPRFVNPDSMQYVEFDYRCRNIGGPRLCSLKVSKSSLLFEILSIPNASRKEPHNFVP